eukprot:scaffold94164_cov21-Tisochrysis_lutea.AAC.1
MFEKVQQLGLLVRLSSGRWHCARRWWPTNEMQFLLGSAKSIFLLCSSTFCLMGAKQTLQKMSVLHLHTHPIMLAISRSTFLVASPIHH